MENQSCSTQTGSCESKASSCGTSAKDCCPIETAIGMWNEAFCQAMRETQVEILKKKIQAGWGPQMDKAGDAVLEAMGVKWQSMLETGKSQMELREKMAKIWSK
jgi:hypothetical protein